MQQLKHTITNQDGATLIIVMLVLVAVTAVGLTAMNISTTEVNLAGNDKWQKIGFYNADPGLHGTPSVIYPNLNEETEQPLAPGDPNDPNDPRCLAYINNITMADFKDLIQLAEMRPEANIYANKDISFRGCDIDADIDITPLGASAVSGGGVEFASRAEGTGVANSQAKVYQITSTGDGSSSAEYTVRGHYRWTETGGGLR